MDVIVSPNGRASCPVGILQENKYREHDETRDGSTFTCNISFFDHCNISESFKVRPVLVVNVEYISWKYTVTFRLSWRRRSPYIDYYGT